MVAGGLVTTVHDMATFNIALDTNFFFDKLTKNNIYSPTKSIKGKSFRIMVNSDFYGIMDGIRMLLLP